MAESKIVCSWRPGCHLKKLDAEKCYGEIESFRSASGGEITAEALVDAARDEGLEIHKAFEWSDKKAAAEHRKNQARYLMRSIAVKHVNAPGQPVSRAFEVSRVDPEDSRNRRKVYSTTAEIMADPESRAALLSRALADLQALRVRFKSLQELAVVWRSVDEVLEAINP